MTLSSSVADDIRDRSGKLPLMGSEAHVNDVPNVFLVLQFVVNLLSGGKYPFDTE
jgi:hypothetical protein